MASSVAISHESNHSKNCETITDDEKAIYDRQIRLWGFDAQNRFVGFFFLINLKKGFRKFPKKNFA